MCSSDLEAREILGMEIEQFKVDLDELQSVTLEGVFEPKARQAYELAGEPVLVEDTGLFIDGLGDLPGALIKWFEGSVGLDGILAMVSADAPRTARAETIVGYWDGEKIISGKGIINGSISLEQRGDNGFGWDTIFIPDGHDRTFAEMTAEEKNSMSMRSLALTELGNNMA